GLFETNHGGEAGWSGPPVSTPGADSILLVDAFEQEAALPEAAGGGRPPPPGPPPAAPPGAPAPAGPPNTKRPPGNPPRTRGAQEKRPRRRGARECPGGRRGASLWFSPELPKLRAGVVAGEPQVTLRGPPDSGRAVRRDDTAPPGAVDPLERVRLEQRQRPVDD